MLVVLFISVSTLTAKVPQKIAILDFTSANKEGGYAFLKKSMPQSLELKLDKLNRFYVIRKYLWEENYIPEKPIETAEDMLRFCLKAGMDGVITGKIIYGINSADVVISVYDASKSSFVLTEKKSIPLNDRIFNTVNDWIEPISLRITNLFPPKDESVIIKERKKIKYVYENIKKKPHQLTLSAGYEYMLANLYLVKASNTMSSFEERSSHPLNGFNVRADYRFKSAEFGFQSILAGGQGHKMTELAVSGSAWLFRDVFNPIIQLSLYHYSFPDVYFKSTVLMAGLKMKPTENFIFGMIMGSSLADDQYYKYFTVDNVEKQNDGGMFLSFLYEVRVSSSLTVNLSMGLKEVRVRYEAINDGRDFSFDNEVSFANVQAAYRLEWGKQ